MAPVWHVAGCFVGLPLRRLGRLGELAGDRGLLAVSFLFLKAIGILHD